MTRHHNNSLNASETPQVVFRVRGVRTLPHSLFATTSTLRHDNLLDKEVATYLVPVRD